MAYTKYSLTPANNNAAPPNGAPEGMLPSAVNDTMRDMMAQIRDVGDGIRGGTYTMTSPVITGGSITGVALSGNTLTNPVITGGSINNTIIGAATAAAGTFSSLSDSGNLTFTGTGNRIRGDFSNATISNRLAFQTSTTNANTNIQVIPNGTATASGCLVFNNSDPTNSAFGQLLANGSSDVRITSGVLGTGAFLPITFFTGGGERVRIDDVGNVGIGTSPIRSARLSVVGTNTIADNQGMVNFYTSTASATNVGASIGLGGQNSQATNPWVYGTIAGRAENGTAHNGYLQFSTVVGSGQVLERMRITSAGYACIGTTSARGGITVDAFVNHTTGATFAGAGGNAAWVTGFTSQSLATGVQTPYSVQAGGIYSVSDARLKENVLPIPSALGFITEVTPVEFDWKSDDTKDTGYIAQDLLAKGYGHLVSSIPDANMEEFKHEDGNVSPAGIRFVAKYDSVVPILHRAIQEQQIMIASLTARIAALESK